ncbi:MAG: DedA family protein [Candidatus Bathyarchaeia archaeon]
MRYTHRRLVLVALVIIPVTVVALSYLEDIVESSETQGGIAAVLMSLPQESIRVASQMGYAGIFLLMLLEAAAFPIPSEIVLPFAGYLVSRGELSFWPVILYSTIAAMLGSFVDYCLGLRFGPLLLRSGKLRFVNADHVRKVDTWFNRYGAFAVVLFRLVPAARVLISFPAGAYQMKKSKFAIYTLAGCLPWNVLLVSLGWWFGASWDYVVGLFRYVNLIAYLFIILAVIWLVLRFRSRASRPVPRVSILAVVCTMFRLVSA